MRTFSLVAAAAVVALSGAIAHAQPAPPPAGRGPDARAPMTRADFDALTDARVAGIKAGLKLSPEQDGLWAPVEKALRDQAAGRARAFDQMRERREARRQGGPRERPDLMQMLERRSEFTSQRAEDLKALTDAMKPFWASLNDQQKKLLPILMRPQGGGRDWHRRGGPGPRPMAPAPQAPAAPQ